MSSFKKKLEDVFCAAAFAEAGEFDTARAMLQGRQKVLLVLTRKASDVKSSTFALNICKRIGAGLEILQVADNFKESEFLARFRRDLDREGIEHRVVKKRGCIKREILSHTQKRNDIQFVVVESSDALHVDCGHEDRKLSGAWKRLRCPLVVVSELESA